MDENKVLNENTANSVPKKKNTLKAIVIALVIAVAATGGAFYYSVNKHIPITPSPAEIISEDELTVMTDEEVTADTLAVEVKSDVDLSYDDFTINDVVFENCKVIIDANRCIIKNCRFINCEIEFKNLYNSIIKDNIVSNSGKFIYLGGNNIFGDNIIL